MTLYLENEYLDKPLDEFLGFDPEETALLVAQTALEMVKCPFDAEVNVFIVDDERIQELNLDQRGIDAPTDVLSFPMVEYSEPEAFSEVEEQKADSFDPESGRLMLGDIVISVDHVVAQADEYGHSKRREFAFLVAHSMLHLVGYDHMEPAEEERMFKKQEEILSAAGIPRT
jgi:probable rRNA maturation factor